MAKRTAISALFLDFDGTISHVEATMETAQPTRLVQDTLHKIAKRIPVAMVTTKDMQFIREKTPFAWAWAAVGGLEIRFGDRVLTSPRTESRRSLFEKLSERLDMKVKKIDRSIRVERKALSSGRLVGICIDWRLAKDWNAVRRRVEGLLNPFKKHRFSILRYPSRPYVDIYPKRIDKRRAFLVLKREMGIVGPTMYMGDSKLDEPAFQVADVSIGVVHSESPSELSSRFFVEFDHIGHFLAELYSNNIVFDPESRWLVLNESEENR
ncbi:MAG: hypothetical protein V1857_03730 [archaeon]